MTAFAPAHSAQYTGAKVTVPPVHNPASDWDGKLKFAHGKLTFTGAGTGTAKMLTLPPGRKVILPYLSRFICPAGTATADAHVGYTAYTEPDGTAKVADDNAFLDNSDIGGGAIDTALAALTLTATAGSPFIIDSKEPVDIEVMIDTAASPAAGDMFVIIAYASAE